VAARAWYRQMLDEPDPRLQLLMNARDARIVKVRVGTLLGVIRTAAAADPDASEHGLDVRRATDVLWTLNHPDIWLLLVGERGWSPQRFERWLADAFCSELLAPS
jgi:hypothetical protein